jgi:hypothetical protein
MKKITLLCIFLVQFFCNKAQSPNLVFSNSYAGNGTNNDYGTSVLDMPNGNVAMAGVSGNLFPSPQNSSTVGVGTFVGLFNEVGANIWFSQFSGTIAQLAKDAANNIYAVGYAQGNVVFINGLQHGSVGTNTLGSQNIVIAKFSPSGTLLWSKAVGSPGDEFGTGIAVDANNDVYVTGFTSFGAGILDFEPSNPLASISTSARSFLVKLSSSGSFIWGKTMLNGGTNYHSVCVDQNNVYWATTTYGINNPINSTPNFSVSTSSGSSDILLVKYRLNGTFITGKAFGGSSSTDYSRGVEVKNGRIALFGAVTSGTSGSVNMNGNSAIPNVSITSNGGTNKDGFIALYDTTNLACQWARCIGGNTVNDETWGGAFDANGNFVVAGLFAGVNTNFNIGGSGTLFASSNGTASDYFYASYNVSSGNCNWLYKQGGTTADQAADVAIDVDGRLWATGYINSGSSGNDMILNKHFCGSTYSVNLLQSNNSASFTLAPNGFYFSQGGCLTQTANFSAVAIPSTNVKYTFYSANNTSLNANALSVAITNTNMALKGFKLMVKDSVTKCEQVYNFQFSQIQSNVNLAISASNTLVCTGAPVTFSGNALWSNITYTWNPGNIVTPSGQYTVSVSPLTTTTYSASVYDGFACVWTATRTIAVVPGPSINLVPSSTSVCSAQSVTLSASGANTYTWTGGSVSPSIVINPTSTSNYSVLGSNGSCAGFASVTINVTPRPVVLISANTTTFCNGEVISLIASGANTYTWNTGAYTSSISVSPTISSTYTVTGNDGTCENSSIINLSVSECTFLKQLNMDKLFEIYPNPSNGRLNISSSLVIENTLIDIFSSEGMLVKSFHLNAHLTELDLTELPNGVYILRAILNGLTLRKTIVKE